MLIKKALLKIVGDLREQRLPGEDGISWVLREYVYQGAVPDTSQDGKVSGSTNSELWLDKVSAEVQACIMSYWQPNHKNISEMSAFLCPHLEGIQTPGSEPASWLLVEDIWSSYRLRWIDNIKYLCQLFWSGVLVLDILK